MKELMILSIPVIILIIILYPWIEYVINLIICNHKINVEKNHIINDSTSKYRRIKTYKEGGLTQPFQHPLTNIGSTKEVKEVIEIEHKPMIDFKDIPFWEVNKTVKVEKKVKSNNTQCGTGPGAIFKPPSDIDKWIEDGLDVGAMINQRNNTWEHKVKLPSRKELMIQQIDLLFIKIINPDDKLYIRYNNRHNMNELGLDALYYDCDNIIIAQNQIEAMRVQLENKTEQFKKELELEHNRFLNNNR